MRTLGIDLAAEPAKTGVCQITWGPGLARVQLERGADDDRVRTWLLTPGIDKAGIDCPFGWPQAFTAAVTAHQRHAAWPGRDAEDQQAYRRSLSYRMTDQMLKDEGHRPLSVSTDRIGVTAMRCALLLDEVGQALGRSVDRAGAGLAAEVYPAAALRAWELLPPTGYKQSEHGRNAREQILGEIGEAVGLELDDETTKLCTDSDDALDALVAALVARAVALGRTTRPLSPEAVASAAVEGWIHVPTCELGELAG
ncbi:DUF429 domain-containing protein [Yinghuangia seranimata]|uniref:DUF429 domain-containing protein n=1 Tax=Yinghuangia seranimata TaxID=408067 RepID=UPI00248A9CF8|nr:DUF429 domain-containing protein [Yinghuangia seranimata]MDI2125688.1 DUF429 domain-containing protein [Yinghuangia seranimata]